ncbi:MAG TPA: hypothetical protein VIK14_17575 [Ignavibacteria bacterium]
MKKMLIILLFISGCSSYDPSVINILNTQKIQGIKSWNISYDSLGFYAQTSSSIVNELSFTEYLSPNSSSMLPNPDYQYAEIRGKNLSDNIKENLSGKGIFFSEVSAGNIVVNRPTFFDNGRYILHSFVTLYDMYDNEIAQLDIFNNCRQRNTTKGIYYDMSGDVLNDKDFAISCAGKIFKVLNQ